MKSSVRFAVGTLLVVAAVAAEAVDRSGCSAVSNAIVLNHRSSSRVVTAGGGLSAMFRTWSYSTGTGLETSDANLGLLLIVR